MNITTHVKKLRIVMSKYDQYSNEKACEILYEWCFCRCMSQSHLTALC